MGRQQRFRSYSGGSLSETNGSSAMVRSKNPSQKAIAVSKEIISILLSLQDAGGKNFLHSAAADTSRDTIGFSQMLLQRISQLDQFIAHAEQKQLNKTSNNDTSDIRALEQALLSRDKESGYTPLHWAMIERNLPSILQLLRHVAADHHNNDGSPHRLLQRPMHLLQGNLKNNSCLQNMVSSVDHEGLTPLELLCRLQIEDLKRCRKSLSPQNRKNTIVSDNDGRRRNPSFDLLIDESSSLMEGNEFQALEDESTDDPIMQDNNSGCEVLTFGRANHSALGSSSSGDAAQSFQTTQQGEVRPQRVQAFALSDVGRDQSAVAIAAGTHHTLVATRNGFLYAFGLGKGGRLGTGDERPRPTPTRVLGSLGRRRVVAVAAADNHSLCVTADGGVYSWGSNRFGQLGSSNEEKNSADSQRCLPRRVDNLKNVFCVSVAVGDRHSVALSNKGEVYTWGDNQAGQLGIAVRKSGNHSPTSGQQVNRVDALWSALPRKVAIAISAAEQSTLVLTRPGASLPTNSVYSWGHGNHVPIKVNFLMESSQNRSGISAATNLFDRNHINPVSIACAKFHNAAVTGDGRVFTWGLHTEPLGTANKTKQKSRSMVIATPQLVTGMLPENGGGTAVAVSVSENHTAVLTDCGHLYTWGATQGNNVLGHEGVRWQPSPKKVSGVYRAVGVSAAKEHTVLLVGTSFPHTGEKLTGSTQPFDSLETLAAKAAAQHVDLFNIIPVSIIAERANAKYLSNYCREFIRLNLDGVLTLGKKSEMDRYLSDQLADSVRLWEKGDRDCGFHPLVFDLVGEDTKRQSQNVSSWIYSCERLLQALPLSLLSKHRASTLEKEESQTTVAGSRRDRALSFNGNKDKEGGSPGIDSSLQIGCSERCNMLTSNMNLTSEDLVRSKFDSLSKEVRGVRKRLTQISKLEEDGFSTLSDEQREKVSRRPLLQADLHILNRALQQVEEQMSHLCISKNIKDEPVTKEQIKEAVLQEKIEPIPNDSEPQKCYSEQTAPGSSLSLSSFRCDICRVTCPDRSSFELHQNGRKHRNKVRQADENDKKQAAASMMEMKRQQQLMQRSAETTPAVSNPWQKRDTSGKSPSVEPKYKLPSPRTFPSPKVAARPPQNTNTTAGTPKTFVASPTQRKTGGAKKSSSFRSILDEEARTASQPKKTPKQNFAVAPMQSPSWMCNMKPASSLPPFQSADSRALTLGKPTSSLQYAEPATKKTYSLGDFLASPTVKKADTGPVGWSSPLAAKIDSQASVEAQKSFLDIQNEEEEFRSKQDTPCKVEGRWYIERRERAGSMSKIQQEEAHEREMELLVAEQKQIEEQIMLERQQQEKKNSPKKKNGRNNRKKQSNAKEHSPKGEKSQPLKTPQSGEKKKQRSRKGDAKNKPKPKGRTQQASS